MAASQPVFLPRTKEPGIDICASSDSIYLIRSDLGCYMRSNGHLDYEQTLLLFPLNPSCSGGDHYLNTGEFFYIIRGNQFIIVNDLSEPTGEDGSLAKKGLNSIQNLHFSCQGGDHYLFACGNFVVIFEASNEYLVVSDLNTGNVRKPLTKMNDCFANGMYYFGPPNQVCHGVTIIHQVDKVWGAMFTNTTRLDSNDESIKCFIYPDIVNFILGGLTMNFGPAVPAWKPLQTFTNTSNAAVTWSKTLTKTVGFNKLQYKSLESNWSAKADVSMGTKFSFGFIAQATIEAQFSLSTTVGSANTWASQEEWKQQYQTEEHIELVVPPGGSVYIWQFTLGLQKSADVLYCRDIQITNSADPPTNIPLPK